ncbi:hypothetical protein SESBI_19641 [Sesbania bispinosa]|nr:hypothetical protein SESBI_19641 [Sesbania bispinosa]
MVKEVEQNDGCEDGPVARGEVGRATAARRCEDGARLSRRERHSCARRRLALAN